MTVASQANGVATIGGYPNEGSQLGPTEHDPEKNPLLSPYKMGEFELKHRVVLAPLTRCRAIDRIPQPAAAEYYSQRASGGLLIAEATCISEEAHGYPHTPGINREEQVEAWKPIVKAVHDKGSPFFLQLWHVGRASHPDLQPGGAAPLSSTNRNSRTGTVSTPKGTYEYKDAPPPRALRADEIPAVVEQFRAGARNALRAGFDGVEVHGAHGYLVDQFLKNGINDRTDEYGGSVENRSRFCLEVVKAVADEVGPEKVGIRLSPFTEFLDAHDSDPHALYNYLLPKLNEIGILYVHLVEPRISSTMGIQEVDESEKSLKPFRELWKGTFMAAGGFDRANGIKAIETNHADLVVYGRLFLANPDLPRRFELDAPLNAYDRKTFYTQDQKVGYLDYPFLDEKVLAKV